MGRRELPWTDSSKQSLTITPAGMPSVQITLSELRRHYRVYNLANDSALKPMQFIDAVESGEIECPNFNRTVDDKPRKPKANRPQGDPRGWINPPDDDNPRHVVWFWPGSEPRITQKDMIKYQCQKYNDANGTDLTALVYYWAVQEGKIDPPEMRKQNKKFGILRADLNMMLSRTVKTKPDTSLMEKPVHILIRQRIGQTMFNKFCNWCRIHNQSIHWEALRFWFALLADPHTGGEYIDRMLGESESMGELHLKRSKELFREKWKKAIEKEIMRLFERRELQNLFKRAEANRGD